MSGLIGALRVTLSADTAAFQKGMSAAERRAKTSSSSIQKSLGGVKASALGLIAGLNAALFIKITKDVLDYASSLGEVSQQLGVTTKDLQTLRYAASQVGISQEEMDKGLGKLTVTLGQVAAGSKAPIAALKAIGISAQDIAGLDTGEAFRRIADGLAGIADRSERAAIEVALFGRTGAKLDTLLSGGSAAINNLTDAAYKLGIVLSDKQIQDADDTADKLAALKTVLEANIASAVSNNAASIIELVNALAQLVAWAGKATAAWRHFALEQSARLLQRRAQSRFLSPQEKLDTLQKIQGIRDEQLAILRQVQPSDTPFVAGVLRGGLGGFGPKPDRVPGVGGMLGGGGGGGGKSAEQLEKERLRAIKEHAEAERRFADDIERQRADISSVMADLSGDIEKRAEAEIQQIDADRNSQLRELEANDKLDAAQREQLKLLADDIATKRIALVEQDRDRDLIRQASEIQQDGLDLQIELLGFDSAAARTAAERREIELRILDIATERERAHLEEIKATNAVTSAAYQEAQMRLDALDRIKAGREDDIKRGTQGPIQSYLDSIPKTAEEINQALEEIAVNGIQDLEDGFARSTAKALGLKGAIGDIAAALIKMAAQQLVLNAFGGANAPSGGGGGFFGGLFRAIGSVGSLFGGSAPAVSAPAPGGSQGFVGPAFATGGSFRIGGSQGYDTNIMSVNGRPIARVNHGEQVHITPANDAGPSRVMVVPSPYFDVVVDGRARGVAAPMVAQGSVDTAAAVTRGSARAQSRRLA